LRLARALVPLVLVGAAAAGTVAAAPTASAAPAATIAKPTKPTKPTRPIIFAAKGIAASSPSYYHGGTGCLTASDGTRTCTVGISGYWQNLNAGYAHLDDAYATNNTGRCLQVSTMRYYYASGAYFDRLGDAGGLQIPANQIGSVKVFGSWPVASDGTPAYTSPNSYFAITFAACTRPGLNGSTSSQAN
jgi:hypothetical protein